MRSTDKQMKLMLDHKDSPYIRGIGFLYLRYACEPNLLWAYMEPYLYDEEPIRIEANPSKCERTVGAFVIMLLTDMDYFGTLMPRLPVNIERDIKVKLLQAEKLEERAIKHLRNRGTLDYFKTLGSKIRALYGDDDNPVTWYDAVVDRVISTDPETRQPMSRPKFVVTFTEYGNTETVTLGEMEMCGGDHEEGTRNNYLGPDRGRVDVGRGGHGRDERGFTNSHDRGNGYRNDGSRGYDDRRRERSRSRENGHDDLLAEVIRREREQRVAKGRNYAARVPTTKDSIANRGDGPRHSAYDNRPSRVPTQTNKTSPPPAPPLREKTAEELSVIAERKRKLMAKYG